MNIPITEDLLSLALILIALLLFIHACQILIRDIRDSYTMSMGGEMHFWHVWLVAGILATSVVLRMGAFSWWWLIPALVIIYLTSLLARRLIVLFFQGTNDEKPPTKGYKEFIRSVEDEKNE